MTRSAARDLAFHLIFERAFRDESMEEIIADAEEARAIEEDEFADKYADEESPEE